MTINLSETFANAKNEFINAVNNGEPQKDKMNCTVT